MTSLEAMRATKQTSCTCTALAVDLGLYGPGYTGYDDIAEEIKYLGIPLLSIYLENLTLKYYH